MLLGTRWGRVEGEGTYGEHDLICAGVEEGERRKKRTRLEAPEVRGLQLGGRAGGACELRSGVDY